ncbi:MAG: polysaccharide deacetylase family protein [Bacteroidia bacterium]|nr:polysaccharide deacetylase family protein [Bacteroidia bacterium]
MRLAGFYHAALSRSLSRLPALLPGAQHRLADTSAVAVTIDDGPTAKGTPPLLEALTQSGIAATFFFTGIEAERHPKLVRDVVAQGHEAASHGYTHDDLFFASRETVHRDMLRSLDAIEQCCGVRPRCYRPPYGRINPFHMDIATRLDCTLVLWSRMPRDFDTRQKGAALLENLRSVRGGDILVLHDNASTLGRLPALVHALARRLRETNLRAVRLSDGGDR